MQALQNCAGCSGKELICPDTTYVRNRLYYIFFKTEFRQELRKHWCNIFNRHLLGTTIQ